MTGFEIFSLIFWGIVALFIVILSVPLHISIGYDEKIRVSIKYLFVKLDILPAKPKQKKEKPPKKEKPAEEKKEEAPPKEKKPNPLVAMVKANGHDGMIEVLDNLKKVLGIYGGKLFKSVIFNEIYLNIIVGTGDSASTAIKYGKTCQQVYPVMGYICSNNLVKKYDINVEPDFLANKTENEFFMDIQLCLRKIINSTVGMVIRLVFKVVLKFLKGGKNQPQNQPSDTSEQTNNANTMKG